MNRRLVAACFGALISACEQRVPVQSKDLPKVEIVNPVEVVDTVMQIPTEIDGSTIDFDTLRVAMTRIEQQLAGGASESEMPKLLLRLGIMKRAHEPPFDDTMAIAYVKARPAEFFYNEFHGMYAYNGHHFREIITRYPNSGLADDAAYLLTTLKSQNQECEGWVPCYLHMEWQPIREFSNTYPTSPYADSAFARIVAVFDKHIDPARYDDDYDTDDKEVLQIVAGVDSVAANLPEPLRGRVSEAVAQWRAWLVSE